MFAQPVWRISAWGISSGAEFERWRILVCGMEVEGQGIVTMSRFFDLVGGSSEDLSFRHGGNGGEEVSLKLLVGMLGSCSRE